MDKARSKKLKINTLSSFIFQITVIVCGFILPRLIISNYGSQVNGLVNSIAQFLQVIALLELGLGAVVQSALYKPLANKDNELVSKIINSAGKFYKKIAIALAVYIVALVVFYPLLVNREFSHIYTATLIITMSISSFAQYLFGIVDRLLLTADQKGYIQFIAQTLTLIINTLACAFLIITGASIHFVKLTTSIIFLLRPLFLRHYVNKHYSIDRQITYFEEPIVQKWNGIAQHLSAFVLDNTDVMVLTFFSTLTSVSVYSVYHLVIYGIKNLFTAMLAGIQALMGEMLAKQEIEELRKFFSWTEWVIHTGTVLLFGCTSVLVVPFIAVYTRGISDANYIVPMFAVLITIAHAGHLLRLPYNIMILAAGHYKQTQSNYIIASLMNIVISVVTVKILGLIGVAIGTLCAMLYQTIWMAIYDSKHIIHTPFRNFIKHLLVDIIIFVVAFSITYRIPIKTLTYLSWIRLAFADFSIWFLIVIIVNLITYRDYVTRICLIVVAWMKKHFQ